MRGISHTFLGMPVVSVSRPMRQLLETVQLVSHSSATVLVEGESGVGKEIVARALHCTSPRAEGPWVNLNCAALPESMMEIELFGSEGPATGCPVPNPLSPARIVRPGMFELADGGTLFLDEIGDLDLKIQGKLLGIMDGLPIFRVGGKDPLRPRVRLVAATNQKLEEAVSAGRFRADLFHRLAQFRLTVPPLRQRVEDVVPLAELFLNEHRQSIELTEDAKRALEAYDWPGNVRELRNVVNMCAVVARGSQIRTLDLPERIQDRYAALPEAESDIKRLFQSVHTLVGETESSPGAMLQDMEKRLILQVLDHTHGHQERAAQLLGISRRTLSRKLRQYESESKSSAVEVA